VAARIVLIAERLADAADLGAGATVLDVATAAATPRWRPPAAVVR
jgi:hypothetical protein